MPPNPFYASNNKYDAQRSIDRGVRLGRLTPGDIDLIGQYIDARRIENDISDGRAKKITSHLATFRRFLAVPYGEATQTDLYKAINAFKSGETEFGTAYAQNTVHDALMIVKSFFRWLIEQGRTTVTEKAVAKIKVPSVDKATTDPGDILTVEEVEQIIKAGKNTRERAFLGVLYESAGRVAEICRLRWKDCVFDAYGAKLYIDDTKTSKRRFIRLTMSADLVANWHSEYPGGAAPEKPLFVSHYKKEFTYIAANRIIMRAVERTEITKRVHAHLFRKSRITHLIAQNYPEATIKDAAWGNQDTGMLRTYIRLRERDHDREFLKHAGVIVEEEKGDVRPIARPCYFCHHVNPPTSTYCNACGRPITGEAKDEVENAKVSVLHNLPQLKILLEKIERGEIDPSVLG